MVTIQVLKRKDASSLIVSIALAMIGFAVIGSITKHLSYVLSGMNDVYDASFKSDYILPLVAFALQVIALEVFLRLIIKAREAYIKSSK